MAWTQPVLSCHLSEKPHIIVWEDKPKCNPFGRWRVHGRCKNCGQRDRKAAPNAIYNVWCERY